MNYNLEQREQLIKRWPEILIYPLKKGSDLIRYHGRQHHVLFMWWRWWSPKKSCIIEWWWGGALVPGTGAAVAPQVQACSHVCSQIIAVCRQVEHRKWETVPLASTISSHWWELGYDAPFFFIYILYWVCPKSNLTNFDQVYRKYISKYII